MKVKVTFKVDSDIVLDDYWDIEYNDSNISFVVDNEMRLKAIEITKRMKKIPWPKGHEVINGIITPQELNDCIGIAEMIRAVYKLFIA